MLTSPYRGIQPFRYVDRAYFFGREETVTELLAKVLVSRLVLLFGESGTGKSSLINAGLIPVLEKEGLSPERLRVRPTPEEPILIERILVGDEDDGRFLPSIFVEDKSVETDTGSQVVSCPLGRFLKTIHETDAYPVLIFDQFEELFTLFAQDRSKAVGEEALQANLLDAIFQIVNDERLKAKVIIVIREDFLGKLEILAKKYPQIFDYRVRLGHLDESGAREAILGPFENKNPFPSRLTPELAGRIIQDLSNSQPNVRIQPTQLQIICSRLWEEYAPKYVITILDFMNIGGVEGILERFLESELAEVEQTLRPQTVEILSHLITESGTRDVVSEDRLRGLIALEKDKSEEELSSTPTILEYLEGRRVVYRTARRGTYYYELANEYLIKRIQELAREQERAEAERRAEEQRLRAEKQASDARRLRLLAAGLAVALLLAVVATVFALVQGNRASEQARISLSRQLAAQALSYSDSQFDLALLLSLEANRVANTVESRRSLLAELASNPHLVTFLRHHADQVCSVAFSPDGRTLASGSGDHTIILWDVTTGQPIGPSLTGHTNDVLSVAFSPDGQTLASGSGDSTVILWDVTTGQPIGQPLTGHIEWVWSVAFSPDGQTLASGSADYTIILWDVATGQPIGPPLTGHTDDVLSVAFSPDGQTLASGSGDNTIILWDVATGQLIGLPLTGHTDHVLSVAFSPDGQTLASGSGDSTVILWDIATGQPIGLPLIKHTSAVLSVAFSPDGRTLASGSRPEIILWDIATGQPIGPPLTGHIGWVRSVAFSPDGQTFASGSGDNTIILWDVTARQRLGQPLTGHTWWVTSVAFSPDGRTLASGSDDNTIILWDVTTGQPIGQPLTGHNGQVYSVAFSPDGRMLASGSADSTVILWDIATGQPIGLPFIKHTTAVGSVAFSPDGRTLASGSNDNTIILWDVTTGQPIGQPLTGHTDDVLSVAFSPDGQTLASGSRDHTIILWDVTTGQPIGQPLTGHIEWVWSVAFSPDGQTLASGSADYTIILWDVATGQPIGPPLTGNSVYSVAFSPDGQTLASGSEDNAIILWDVATGQLIGLPLTGHTGRVHSVAFSPDGQTLASGSGDSTVILWNLSFESWQVHACSVANRNLTPEEWKQYIGDEPYLATCPKLPLGEGVPPDALTAPD